MFNTSFDHMYMYIMHIHIHTYTQYIHTAKNYTKVLMEIVSGWWAYGSFLSFKFIFNKKYALLIQNNKYLKLHHLFATTLILNPYTQDSKHYIIIYG